MPSAAKDQITLAANAVAEKLDSDVFLYNSEIVRPLDEKLIEATRKRERRKNVCVFLVTEGGDPDAAYRVARCFQTRWQKFICVVPGYCKSAGALILTGAHELVIDDAGELGPLDIQLTKKDELSETESSLTVMSALDALREKSFSAFEHFFLTATKKSGNRVTFKTAAEFGVKLTVGLFNPIFQQIDPIHVGEASRAQAISHSYGLRLSFFGRNISADSLKTLVSGYPSHGFVIDRAEALALFRAVREPNTEEQHLIGLLADKATVPFSENQAIREFLSEEKRKENVIPTGTEVSTPRRAGPRRIAAVAGEDADQQNVVGGPTAVS